MFNIFKQKFGVSMVVSFDIIRRAFFCKIFLRHSKFPRVLLI